MYWLPDLFLSSTCTWTCTPVASSRRSTTSTSSINLASSHWRSAANSCSSRLSHIRGHSPFRRVQRASRSSPPKRRMSPDMARSEEHTSELQSPDHLLCRLLLEKKKNNLHTTTQH